MKKFLLLLLLCCAPVFAQEDAWVYFTDKPEADYYLANPLEMLSQKALNRRENQNIALDEADVPLHQPYVDAVTASDGITVMARSKWFNALHIRGSVEDINALTTLAFVDYVDFADKSLNSSGRMLQTKAPDKFAEVEAEFDYGLANNQIEMLNGQALHLADFTGTGMTIAVLDSGFPGVNTAAPFQRLFDNGLILGGYDFVDKNDTFYDDHFHGTRVLSTMGGYADGDLVGTAPDAFYYLFRTEDAASENPVEESYWVEAAEVADSLGVDVINTSLGYYIYDNPAYSYTFEDIDGQTSFISRGTDIAFSRGMICVTSAGNSGASDHPFVGVPADAVNVLSVGAVDAEEVRAYFSSTGPTADGRIKPDVMARGVASVISNPDGDIIAANGTSFSGPITAGLVACLWQALPDKTNAEIVQIVKQSADRYNNPDGEYGYGIPDFAFALDTALASQATKNKILLYPNPAQDVLSVKGLKGISTVMIFNSLGQQVLNESVSPQSTYIQVGKLPDGIYTYSISGPAGSQTGQLIKN